jgi:serine/threonine protein kinase
VEALIRTEGHFYLIGKSIPLPSPPMLTRTVETFAANHVPLSDHPLPISPSRAAKILDQLVSVLRDCLHEGRVCHRDLKGENVLVDLETGDILLIGEYAEWDGRS